MLIEPSKPSSPRQVLPPNHLVQILFRIWPKRVQQLFLGDLTLDVKEVLLARIFHCGATPWNAFSQASALSSSSPIIHVLHLPIMEDITSFHHVLMDKSMLRPGRLCLHHFMAATSSHQPWPIELTADSKHTLHGTILDIHARSYLRRPIPMTSSIRLSCCSGRGLFHLLLCRICCRSARKPSLTSLKSSPTIPAIAHLSMSATPRLAAPPSFPALS
jgi:hypothetical protein